MLCDLYRSTGRLQSSRISVCVDDLEKQKKVLRHVGKLSARRFQVVASYLFVFPQALGRAVSMFCLMFVLFHVGIFSARRFQCAVS